MSAPEPENLSPAELAQRELQEKERKAREEAEQAQLPYKWTQTIRDLDVTAPIPANIKGRDMQVTLTKTKIKVAIKGQDPIIEVRAAPLSRSCVPPLTYPVGRFPSPDCRGRIIVDPRNHSQTPGQGSEPSPR